MYLQSVFLYNSQGKKLYGSLFKCNQVIGSLLDIVPDVVSLVEQIHTASSIFCVSIDLANVFFLVPYKKDPLHILLLS